MQSGRQTTMPGNDSPGVASRAVRLPGYFAGEDGSAGRILLSGLPDGDLLGGVATILPLQQADFRLDAGFHGDDLIVGQSSAQTTVTA